MGTLIRLFDAVINYWPDIIRIFTWMKDNQADIAMMADYLNPPEEPPA